MPKKVKIKQKYNLYSRKTKAKYGKDWPAIRKKVLIRDGNRCRICENTKGLHVHHIIPLKISHSNEDLNLVTLCRSCHKMVESVAWKLLENGAHRYQIYEASWKYINDRHNKILLENKIENHR